LTGTEIKALADSIVDDTIDPSDAVMWINDYVRHPDLVDKFRKTGEQEIEVTDSRAWHERTPGHLKVVDIVDDEGNGFSGGIELSHDRARIRIPRAGHFAVTSLVRPERYTNLEEEPDVNEVFHEPCAVYIAAEYKLKDNDQNPDGLRLLVEAMDKTASAATLLSVQDMRTEDGSIERMREVYGW